MSGVAALLRLIATNGAADENGALIAAMQKRMAHRGSDGSWQQQNDVAGIGLQLFATTPEDEGSSVPLALVDAPNVWAAADLRLDNREELHGALGTSRDVSDQELLLRAFLRWGDDCVDHLLGEFAFVVMDLDRRRLVAARDPMGVRPLYYHVDPTRIILASEPWALLADAALPPRPDPSGIALFIADQYTEHRHTVWASIAALPPAHRLVATTQALHVDRFWRPDPWRALPRCSTEDYAVMVRETLEASVAASLRSSRRVAVAVSGGIDSSAILGAMESLRGRGVGPAAPPLALHIHHPDQGEAEVVHSRALVERWGVPYREVSGAPRHWTDARAVDPGVFYDARFDGLSRLFAAMREHGIRTLFTGDAVDLYVRRSPFEIIDAVRRFRFHDAATLSGLTATPLALPAWRKVGGAAVRAFAPAWLRRLHRKHRRPPSHQLLTPRFSAVLAAEAERRHAETEQRSFPSAVARDICSVLEESYYHGALAIQNRTLSRAGVEIRSPWQDLRLIDLLLAMPHELRASTRPNDPPKPIVRRAAAPWVPKSILERTDTPHVGGGVESALFGARPHALRELVRDGCLVNLGIVRPDALEKITNGARRPVLGLMNLVAAELWLRQVTQ